MKQLLMIRSVVFIIVGLIIIQFEAAQETRLLIMIGGLTWLVISPLIRKIQSLRGVLIILDLMAIVVLLGQSRFMMNYLILLMPFFVFAEIVFCLKNEWQVVTGLIFLGMISYYFYRVAEYGLNYEKIIQMAFIYGVYTLGFVTLTLLATYLDVKDKMLELNDSLTFKNEALIAVNRELSEVNMAFEASQLEVIRLTKIKERALLARDLHDSVGHELTGLMMLLEMAKRQPDRIEEGIVQARKTLKMLRETVSTIEKPLDDEPFRTRIFQRVKQFKAQTDMAVIIQFDDRFEFKGNSKVSSNQMAHECYAMLTEALTNIAKHTSASTVWLNFTLLSNGSWLMKVRNDGVEDYQGLESSKVTNRKGNGLRFMANRAKSIGAICEIFEEAPYFTIVIKGDAYD